MKEIMDDVAALVDAIKTIASAWEGGDLAGAVHCAEELADTLAQQYDLPPYEQDDEPPFEPDTRIVWEDA